MFFWVDSLSLAHLLAVINAVRSLFHRCLHFFSFFSMEATRAINSYRKLNAPVVTKLIYLASCFYPNSALYCCSLQLYTRVCSLCFSLLTELHIDYFERLWSRERGGWAQMPLNFYANKHIKRELVFPFIRLIAAHITISWKHFNISEYSQAAKKKW